MENRGLGVSEKGINWWAEADSGPGHLFSVMVKNPFPTATADLSDLRGAISKYILPGYVPEAPFLQPSATALTMGSCFATTINTALRKAGISSAHIEVSETINTPALTNLLIQSLLGADTSALAGVGTKLMTDAARAPMFERMKRTDVFIVTVGVALQPIGEDGRPIFSMSTMAGKKGAVRGANWRMLSVAEIGAYLRSIITGLNQINPSAAVVLTLSPIPLTNSLRHRSSFGADCVSKSNLRAAIAEVMEDGIKNVFYWPSFEVVRWLGGHVGPFFGTEEQDQRHVAPSCIDLITSLFIESYFKPRLEI